MGESVSSIDFFVYNTPPEPPNPKINKDVYYTKETVEITWDEVDNTDCYWLHIYRNGDEYINQTLNKDLSYSATYPSGNYTAYIASCNGMGETISSITFNVIEKGDIDNNGELTITDAVHLQQWLLSESGAELPNWKAADLYEDDRIDSFDMVQMRKLLIENK